MISTNRASVVNNVIITTIGTYGETLLALIASAIIARALGPSEYGIYTYVIFLSGWMIKLSNISLPATAIRFVAESRGSGKLERSSRVAGILLTRQTINSVLVCLGFILFLQFFTPEILEDQHSLLYALICVAVFFKARYVFTVSIAKGHERFDIEAISTILVGIATIAMVAVLAFVSQRVDSFVMVYTISSYLMLVAAWHLCRSNGIRYERGPIDSEYLDKVHKYRRLAVLLGLVALLGGSSLEMFLLGQYATTAQVGFFALSIALTRGLNELCTAGLSTILMPRMAHAFGADNVKGVRNIFLESTRFYIFFGIGLGLSGLVIAEPVIFIVFGSEFIDAAWVFAAVLMIAGYGMTSAAVGAFLSTTDRQDVRVKFAVSVLIVHFVLVFSLVPLYGLLGAVVSSACSTLFRVVLGFQWVVRNLGVALPYGLYLRLLSAGLLAMAPALALAHYVDFVAVDIFAAVLFAGLYLLLSIKLGCWYSKDLDLVKHVVSLLPGAMSTPLTNWINAMELKYGSGADE